MSEQPVALRQPDAAERPAGPGPRPAALRALAAVGIFLAAGLWIAGVPPLAAAVAVALYAAIALAVATRVAAFHPFLRFGAANLLTLLRAGLACLIAAMVLAPAASDAWWYTVFVLALAALALDGLDGFLARKSRLASRFGARFDMEVDALLILILSASAFLNGKAGAWVLLLGLMRYLFVAAGLVLPALGAPLPPSLRRKAVCVLEVGTLGLLLLPVIVPPLSGALAFAALAALAWSFALDVRWLLGPGRGR